MAGRGTCAIGLLAAAGGALFGAASTEAEAVRWKETVQRDASALARTTAELHRAIDRWRRQGNPAVGRPPGAVERAALAQQRLVLRLTSDPQYAQKVVSRTSGRVRRHAQTAIGARLTLLQLGLPSPRPLRSFRAGTPLPAGVLLSYYRQAERRFGVGWHVLAAVNFVESGFGRIRSPSSAGALGPMQFMPPTWRAYGLGGDVFKARDAVMGAANYLRASGAPGDYWGALYHYNRSDDYVEAVLRYAGLMKRDIRAYYAFYSWQVFVRTRSGLRRLAEPPPPMKCCDKPAPRVRDQRKRGAPQRAVRLRTRVRQGGTQPQLATAPQDSPPEVRARANARPLLVGSAVSARDERASTPLRNRPRCCSRAARGRTRHARAPPRWLGSAWLPSVRRAGT
jgi:soluble lytic murein transglycosylase-like protein